MSCTTSAKCLILAWNVSSLAIAGLSHFWYATARVGITIWLVPACDWAATSPSTLLPAPNGSPMAFPFASLFGVWAIPAPWPSAGIGTFCYRKRISGGESTVLGQDGIFLFDSEPWLLILECIENWSRESSEVGVGWDELLVGVVLPHEGLGEDENVVSSKEWVWVESDWLDDDLRVLGGGHVA